MVDKYGDILVVLGILAIVFLLFAYLKGEIGKETKRREQHELNLIDRIRSLEHTDRDWAKHLWNKMAEENPEPKVEQPPGHMYLNKDGKYSYKAYKENLKKQQKTDDPEIGEE